MKRKIAALALGITISAAILYFLDPYVPMNGVQGRKSENTNLEQLKILTDLAQEPKWQSFIQQPRMSVGKVAELRRDASIAKMISGKYAVMSPNTRMTDKMLVRFDGETRFETIYDAIYTTDSVSRRTTISAPSTFTKSLIFLGCSFTWGSGVDDEDTFSSAIARFVDESRAFNLGIRGAGPNDVIDDLIENPQRLSGTAAEKGIAVYTMIGDQIERALCRSSCYTEPGLLARPFRLDKTKYVLEDGHLKNVGAFRNESPITREMKRLFFGSRLLNYLYYEWDPDSDDQSLFLIAKMFERIRDEIKRKTGFEFYVAFFPDNEIKRHEAFLAALDKVGVSYFDFSGIKFNEALAGRSRFPIDRHPTKLGYEAYARLLVHELKKKSPEFFEAKN